jgi:hypothetical protein
MHKYAFALLVVTILILPLSLRACDDEVTGLGVVHFKDGRSPLTIRVDYAGGDTEGYSSSFAFRDYGPPHAVAPPAPAVQHLKGPSS